MPTATAPGPVASGAAPDGGPQTGQFSPTWSPVGANVGDFVGADVGFVGASVGFVGAGVGGRVVDLIHIVTLWRTGQLTVSPSAKHRWVSDTP